MTATRRRYIKRQRAHGVHQDDGACLRRVYTLAQAEALGEAMQQARKRQLQARRAIEDRRDRVGEGEE